MKITPEMRASHAFVTRRALLVPVCLCVIAAGHVYRVFACGQTAWKGGGFGMFSTVDAENARFVKCYLQTTAGEIPVELPAVLQKKGAVLRAAPNQAGANDLAQRLAKLTWHDSQARWSHIANKIAQAPRQAVAKEMLHPVQAQDRNERVHPAGSPSTLEAISANEGTATIPVHSVRVEVWRYRYDAATRRLNAELMVQSQHAREEHAL